MRNIFLEKSYIKCGRKTIPAPFPKIDIETKLQTTCFYLIYETFKKKQKEAWN